MGRCGGGPFPLSLPTWNASAPVYRSASAEKAETDLSPHPQATQIQAVSATSDLAKPTLPIGIPMPRQPQQQSTPPLSSLAKQQQSGPPAGGCRACEGQPEAKPSQAIQPEPPNPSKAKPKPAPQAVPPASARLARRPRLEDEVVVCARSVGEAYEEPPPIEVVPGLWPGSENGAKDADWLQTANVALVVDCRGASAMPIVKARSGCTNNTIRQVFWG